MNILFYGLILLCVIPAVAILAFSTMGMASPTPAPPTPVPQIRKNNSTRNHISSLLPLAAMACVLAVGGCDSATTGADYEAVEAELVEEFLAAVKTGDVARIEEVFGVPEKSVYRVSVPAPGGARLQYDGPDPDCEWSRGDSEEELREFTLCLSENITCRREYSFEVDGEGQTELTEIHIHCEQ